MTLEEARESAGLTRSQVIRKIPHNHSCIFRYENGYSIPNAKTFIELCRLYKVKNPYDIEILDRRKKKTHDIEILDRR